ncbi:MAG: hypothetical protein ABIZ91_15680 [Gemmatimonadaceae bacterium]
MERYEFIIAMTSILMGGFFIISVVTSIGRIFGRRRNPASLAEAGLAQIDQRLDRMEQAIDAMSVEMERVSEAQRFTAKLLTERSSERASERAPERASERART